MAVDQALLDDIAANVAQLFREVESALTRQIADRLRDDMDHPYAENKLDAVRKLQRSAQTILAALNNRVADVVRQSIAQAYRDGWGSALEDLPAAWFRKSGIGQDAARAREVIPNTAAIESLAVALIRDIGEKSRNVLRDVLDAYRAVQTAAAARVLAGVQTRRQASQSAWQRLVDQGITSFVDRAGRRWRLSSYVEMAARTNAQRAAVQAQTDRLGSLGVPLVFVSNAPQECKWCRPFEGQILSLDGRAGERTVPHQLTDKPITVDVMATLDDAMRAGLFHPNCRHSISAYLPGVTRLPQGPTEDPDGDVARQRQRAIEREIRKYKERANTALTPDGKKAASARVREWQKEMRDHLAAHPELKRLRYREQVGAGNVPPAGGPNGGPTGQIEPPTQPTLDGGPGGRPTASADETPSSRSGRAPGQQDLLDVEHEPRRPEPRTPKAPKPKAEPQRPARKPLEERLASGEKSREQMSQGLQGEVTLVHLNDGSKVVYKRYKPNPNRYQTDEDAVRFADAEELGAAVARKLGVPAPETRRVGPKELFMDFMDGKLADGARKPTRYWESDDGWRMALLDALVDYPDRHGGNWLLNGKRIVSIDHGLSFGYKDRALRPLPDGLPSPHNIGPFEKLLMRPTPGGQFGIGEWIDNDLSPEDINAARRRLEDLRQMFADHGRLDWYETMLQRLDRIAPHAKGTKRRIEDP